MASALLSGMKASGWRRTATINIAILVVFLAFLLISLITLAVKIGSIKAPYPIYQPLCTDNSAPAVTAILHLSVNIISTCMVSKPEDHVAAHATRH